MLTFVSDMYESIDTLFKMYSNIGAIYCKRIPGGIGIR